jgi:ribosomal protein S6
LKTYDALFIFSTNLKDEDVDKVVEKISGEITKLKGKVTDKNLIGKRDFSRQLKKSSSGKYVSLRIAIEPGSIDALKARFKLIEDIFRMQMVVADDRLIKVGSSHKEVVQDGESK